MSQLCLHCYIEGNVQGVFYRHATREKAKQLGITGWVKNLSDGRVEVLACGEEQPLEELRNWLWDGPPRADVTDVTIQELAWEEHSEFEVK
jgi:acylphosphatase